MDDPADASGEFDSQGVDEEVPLLAVQYMDPREPRPTGPAECAFANALPGRSRRQILSKYRRRSQSVTARLKASRSVSKKWE
jgi:hypothetical protein